MSINGRGETVVVKITVHAGAEVNSLHHAAGGQDAQQRVEVKESLHTGLVQGVRQCLGWISVDLYILMEKGKKSWKSLNALKHPVREVSDN